MFDLLSQVVIVHLLLVDVLLLALVLEDLREQDHAVLLVQTVQGQTLLEDYFVLLRQVLAKVDIEERLHEQGHCGFPAPRRLVLGLLVVDVADGVLQLGQTDQLLLD